MPHIINQTTLQAVKDDIARDPDAMIYYGVNTCWWTHRSEDLRRIKSFEKNEGLPCDPRGGVLMMAPALDFIENAEQQPEHYGRHGLAAFIAAHNDNCVVDRKADPLRQWCMRSWEEYNALLD